MKYTSCAAILLFLSGAGTALAQTQTGANQVVVDYGVLDQLGAPAGAPGYPYRYPSAGVYPSPYPSPYSPPYYYGQPAPYPSAANGAVQLTPPTAKAKRKLIKRTQKPTAQVTDAGTPSILAAPAPAPASEQAPQIPAQPDVAPPPQPTPLPQTGEAPAPASPEPQAPPPAAPADSPAPVPSTASTPSAPQDSTAQASNPQVTAPPEAPSAALAATPPAEPPQPTSAAKEVPLDTPQQEASVAPAAKNSDSPAPAAQNGDGAPAAGQVRLLYAPDVDELADTAQKQLDEIVQKLNGDENLRVQIFAYASGAPDAESNARRKSLARGLNVRAYLIKAGIRSTRIEIRALGSKVPDGGPADRVDVAPLAS